MRTTLSLAHIGAVIDGTHANPFEVLGPHEVHEDGRRATAVRAYFPDSQRAWVFDPAHRTARPMRRIHPAGFYEAICPWADDLEQRSYQLRVEMNNGKMKTLDDPYAYPSILTGFDLHLLGEGRHYHAYERLGAQLRTVNGVAGVNFAVWAPNATAVSVVGDFNEWDERCHLLRKHFDNGIWEIFIPGATAGQNYKYRLKTRHGEILEKSDPYGFASELPPRTASVVADLDNYSWGDSQWLHRRRETNALENPASIYEVHLGSWRRRDGHWLSYREIADELVPYCLEMGFTHIELLPVSEHPFYGSWGYQPVGYFSATSRYGSPEEFMYFVDHCHRNGIGVIIDWVPAHFPRDGHGLRRFDGTALYEHEDPRLGEHPDWGTMVFNYGRNEVRNYLIANAMFWFDKYHIDGLRVDAVASMLYLDYSREDGQWIPNEHGGRENLAAVAFLQEFNRVAHEKYPGVLTIAEESTAWGGVSRPTDSGGLGFSMKWNMGWMNDTLRYFSNDPIHRCYHHHQLTFSLIYAFSENFVLPFSHDEVVHGKGSLIGQMPGDLWQKFANLRLLYSYMWTHPGKKLLFMGNELAQWNEWNHEQPIQWELLDWETHRGVQKLVADLNALYKNEAALYELDFDGSGFEWIDCDSSDESVLAYIRRAKDPSDWILVCCNLTPVVRLGHRVGVPQAGDYREIFNSDSQHYGGSNVGTHLGAVAEDIGHHGRPNSIVIDLPPLAVTIFKPRSPALPE